VGFGVWARAPPPNPQAPIPNPQSPIPLLFNNKLNIYKYLIKNENK